MIKLLKTECLFSDFLLNNNKDLANELCLPSKGNISTRMDVYGNGYFERLSEVIDSTFPGLSIYLGSDEFEVIKTKYLSFFHSSSFSICHIGNKLPLFLKVNYKNKPELSDLALIEVLLDVAYDAVDTPILKIEDLKSIPFDRWSSLTFNLQPSVQMGHVDLNNFNLYESIINNNDDSYEAAFDDKQILLLVWRYDCEVHYMSLSESQQILIEGIANNLSFEYLCGSLTNLLGEENIAMFVANQLVKWVNDEIFRV